MTSVPSPNRYGGVAVTLHWLVFFLIAGSFALGLTMTELDPSPLRLRLYSYHKWLGVTIFLVMVLRLAWRFRSPPPPLPESMPAWERIAARLSHGGLYLLLFAIPISGWLMSSAKGFQTVYFGVLPIPDLLAKDADLGEWLEEAHEWLGQAFLALAAVHVAVALKHHYVDRDDVLTRMTPGLAPLPPRRAP